MTDLTGRSLGRYRIVELLGAGGMGIVYRAKDEKLRRDVAIKVLSEEITENPRMMERFEREARALARLSHPNILAIHDFRTEDGFTFAVEELLEGRDLRHSVTQGPTSVDRAVEIICAVAEGLGAAHRKGILHRDIKPENIFVSADGGVKILDFGLARSFQGLDPEASTMTERSALTTPGAVVGTTSYMSPEQTRGEELNPKADVFSLGIVFYELLTGVHPFREATAAETLASILRKNPPPPSAVVATIPPALDAIVGRCLEKSPEERFESARDIAFALKAMSGRHATISSTFEMPAAKPRNPRRRLAAAGAVVVAIAAAAYGYIAMQPAELPEIKRITVARFEAEGDDPELRYLAAGLSEVVAQGLEIVAEGSPDIDWVETRRLGRRREPDALFDAYRDYNIRIGVGGRLHRTADGFLLDLEVINSRNGEVLRETRIEESLLNPFAVQVLPVERLATEVGVDVKALTVERLREVATDVPPALDPYLHGLGRLALAGDATAASEAKDLIGVAFEQDPRFDKARVAAARACRELYRYDESRSWLVEGVELARSAADGDAVPIPALLAVASLRSAMGDREGELDALRRAVEIDPEHGEARRRSAAAMMRSGRLDEAEREYQRAIYLQPGYWPNHHYLAQIFISQGRYEAAANEFRRVVELAPLYVGGYTNLGVVYGYLDRDELAKEIFEQSLEVDHENNYAAFTNLGTIYYDERRFADSVAMNERALAIDDGEYAVWGNLASARKFVGNTDRAAEDYRRAIELARSELEARGDDAEILTDLGIYYAAIGEKEQGLESLAGAAALDPQDPLIVARIAECYEDLEERERALEWVERAFSAGAPPEAFENNPTLRELVADERYQEITRSMASTP
ncbi:MAG: protein kinase [Thermoanaerobaculales bacterium]|jgi:serine/threonine-protein kinase|nr:protein kinase [Thermoanaerobaculales bacterium]